MTLDELKDIQRQHDLRGVHLVCFHEGGAHGEGGYDMAHTDPERASGMDLHDCRVHKWLEGFGSLDDVIEELEVEPDVVYVITAHKPDPVSESYRSEPWELHPLEEPS